MSRNYNKISIYLLVVLFTCNLKAQQLPSKSEILSKLKLGNEYWMSVNPGYGNNQWARSVYFIGNTEFYKIYPNDMYKQYTENWCKLNNWSLNGGTQTRNADNQTCGQVYFDLYMMDSIKQDAKIVAITSSINNMANSNISTDWWWIDALFIAMPVFTRFGIQSADTVYLNRMHQLYKHTKDSLALYNYSKGLWYRDASFKPPYSTKDGEDSFWSRGNGWVIAAHARVLELLPANNPHRNEYVQTFQQMAAALKIRQRSDGFWNPSLDDPNEFSGPETSGTAFFTFAIAWGVNNHLLDSAEYHPTLVKAWDALSNTALQSNGFLGYVQGVGASPAQAYANVTQDFGVGAFLLAGSELLKMTKGELPEPGNFYIKSVNVIDKTHLSIYFSKPTDTTTAFQTENYVLSNEISILRITKGANYSTLLINCSELDLGKYQLSARWLHRCHNNCRSSREKRTIPTEKRIEELA